jgi:hypothetical protein
MPGEESKKVWQCAAAIRLIKHLLTRMRREVHQCVLASRQHCQCASLFSEKEKSHVGLTRKATSGKKRSLPRCAASRQDCQRASLISCHGHPHVPLSICRGGEKGYGSASISGKRSCSSVPPDMEDGWDAILLDGPEETEPEELVPEEIDPIESRTASAAHRFAQRLQRMIIVSSAKTGSRGSVMSLGHWP